MNTKEYILSTIRQICFFPTWAERKVKSDLYFMHLTSMATNEKYLMAVAALKDGGIRLVYKPDFVDALSPNELRFVLNHEAQHLVRDDNHNAIPYFAHRDWYGEWEGKALYNYAADFLINDRLRELGFDPERLTQFSAFGGERLGHSTTGMEIEAVMREIVEKLEPPPPEDQGDGDLGDDVETSSEDSSEHVDMESERAKAGNNPPKRKPNVNENDVARWTNFLAEVLDTKKQEDTWKRIPKRLSGINAYMEREYVRCATIPLPRKCATIAIDTSSSMEVHLVSRLLSAVRNSPASYDLEVICFNNKMEVWENFRSSDTIPNVGGGTDLDPVATYIKQARRLPERIIVLTDGEFPMPTLPHTERWMFGLYGCDITRFPAPTGSRVFRLEELIK